MLNAPKNPFIISSRSQSVLRSSFRKTFRIEEPQTDSHVTTLSAVNVESISHEAPTDTKDEIDIEPPTKIKRKSKLNHHTDKIPHEIGNESQLIDEHFLEEPELNENEPHLIDEHFLEEPGSTENEPQLIDKHLLEEPASTNVNLADPMESCDKVHGMLNNLLQTLHNGRSLVDRDFKEDFLTGTKKLLTEIECKVHDMLPIINDSFVQHVKDMRDIVSRGKCPDDVSDLFISGHPAGRLGINFTDQHREYLLSKAPQRPMLDSYPVNSSITASK